MQNFAGFQNNATTFPRGSQWEPETYLSIPWIYMSSMREPCCVNSSYSKPGKAYYYLCLTEEETGGQRVGATCSGGAGCSNKPQCHPHLEALRSRHGLDISSPPPAPSKDFSCQPSLCQPLKLYYPAFPSSLSPKLQPSTHSLSAQTWDFLFGTCDLCPW